MKCNFLDFVMPKITLLGNAGAIWILAAIVLMATKKYRKHGIILLASLAVCLLIGNIGLKNIVARQRPCWLNDSVTLLISNPKDFSFPSGHTLASVASATVLTLSNKKFAIWAIPLCVLLSFSRLYLYVHFPTDVLASVVLGIAIGGLTFLFGNKLLAKNKLF